MSRTPVRRNLATDIEPEIRERADIVVELLRKTGLEVRESYFRRLPGGAKEGRLTLFVRIKPRFRLPYGFIEDEGVDLSVYEPTDSGEYRKAAFAPTRERLTAYADKLRSIEEALVDYVEQGGGKFGEPRVPVLCRLLAEQGVDARGFDNDNHNGLSLRFPHVDRLFLGAYRADIAEAIFVLLSHDDPRKGIETVRRLR